MIFSFLHRPFAIMEQTMPSPPSKQPNASSLEGLLAVIAMQDEKIKDLEAIVEAQV